MRNYKKQSNIPTTFRLQEEIILYSDLMIDGWIAEAMDGVKVAKSRKRGFASYYNVASAFDIETTSFYDGEMKRGTMYAWVFGLNGRTVIGRTWKEYNALCTIIKAKLHLCNELYLPIYIHNAMFDWHFIRTYHEWRDVFALNTRRVARAQTTDGLEFRCSYILTGKNLAEMAADCKTYPVKKMVGDLDYSLKRHSGTPMTRKEYCYINHDALVVMSYIQEQLLQEVSICTIPMTKTGYVRRRMRKLCLNGNGKYYNYIHRLNLDPDEFMMAQAGFCGGFTHGSAWRTARTIINAGGYDLCSAYSAAELLPWFPSSKGIRIDTKHMKKEHFEYYLNNHCCLMDVTFTNLAGCTCIDHPLSRSHCYEISDMRMVDNGRVVYCDSCSTVITELDLDVFKLFYKWDKMKVNCMYVYKKDYLPKEYIQGILELYGNKTKLKGVPEMERQYQRDKGDLNSSFGMMVTSPIRDHIYYDTEWHTDSPDIMETLEKYNDNKGRFLYYLWGVWTTAVNRWILLTTIYSVGQEGDYLYADTDSIKLQNPKKYKKIFDQFNRWRILQNKECMKHFGLPMELVEPETIKGEKKPIGIFEYDSEYKAFKYLGAKRYMYLDADYNLNIVVSGLNKKKTVPWMMETYGKYGAFAAFNNALQVPPEATGKMTHTYDDQPFECELTDYCGITQTVAESGSIHLEEAGYDMSVDGSFFNDIIRLQQPVEMGI